VCVGVGGGIWGGGPATAEASKDELAADDRTWNQRPRQWAADRAGRPGSSSRAAEQQHVQIAAAHNALVKNEQHTTTHNAGA
jgi:hypothetical protein